jgi:DtxR family transcriptional regulator, Mn-dependent transcriptional regulator
MENSYTIENYLKAIYKLSEKTTDTVTTNDIAAALNTKASSANDMIKKLAAKKYIKHQKYRGVQMTDKGTKIALMVIRKHRLWELFLVKTLGFKWDEVHVIAEQMEHVVSDVLVNRLDHFLGYPKFDPHGDPIPDTNGKIQKLILIPLGDLKKGQSGILTAVVDHSDAFFRHLEKFKLNIGCKLKVIERNDYDNSLNLSINKNQTLHVSNNVASNLLIKIN